MRTGIGISTAGYMKIIIPALLFIVMATAALLASRMAPFYVSGLTVNYALQPDEIAVIVNDDDPLSLQIAEYFQTARNIPDENMIHLSFPPKSNTLEPELFRKIYKTVADQTPRHVQGYLLAWPRPFRVGCMSITMAFATNYNQDFCPIRIPRSPCSVSKRNPLYASDSRRPWDDYQIRPAMLLAAGTLESAKQLIDRGTASDSTQPTGTVYLLSTSDVSRNVRARNYGNIIERYGKQLAIEILEQDSIQDKNDVMFYFTGIKRVENLHTLKFLPGAVADHLTSFGGNIKISHEGDQMSSLRWLEAGATGSYGTVLEPCAFTQKFPDPEVLLHHYLKGESLLLAYWKSVEWPSEGLFIGEPLAAPYSGKIK